MSGEGPNQIFSPYDESVDMICIDGLVTLTERTKTDKHFCLADSFLQPSCHYLILLLRIYLNCHAGKVLQSISTYNFWRSGKFLSMPAVYEFSRCNVFSLISHQTQNLGILSTLFIPNPETSTLSYLETTKKMGCSWDVPIDNRQQ